MTSGRPFIRNFWVAGRSWRSRSGGAALVRRITRARSPEASPTSRGRCCPGASVTVINERTARHPHRHDRRQGHFQVTSLAPGTYTDPRRDGELPHRGAHAQRPQRRRTTVARHVPHGVGLGESVVVEASGAAVSTEDSQHSGLITAQQIEQIQVKGRDVTSLMRLVPGVRYEDTAESLGESFGTLVPHVSGQRRDWNTIMVDGVLGNEVGQTNRMAQQINLDAVGEIKVLLNTYRAEYGRGGRRADPDRQQGRHAGVPWATRTTTAATRSSTRTTSSTTSRDARGRSYRFNTFGFNLGGPIPGLNKGDEKKFFFFYSIEAPLTERPGPLRSYRVPTEAERRGDFSQTRDLNGDLIAIRDPLTGQNFPGNIVPASRINPNGLALLNMLPLPNVTGQPRLQLPEAGDRREPEDEQRPAPRLAALAERQLLRHLQGLVVRPAGQRGHRGARQVGLVQHALPEHRQRRPASTTRRSSART